MQTKLLTVVHGVDGVGLLIRDLDGELLLNGHDNLDGVKRVKTEVLGEVGSGGELGSA